MKQSLNYIIRVLVLRELQAPQLKLNQAAYNHAKDEASNIDIVVGPNL
jgi:hypothetical protein